LHNVGRYQSWRNGNRAKDQAAIVVKNQ